MTISVHKILLILSALIGAFNYGEYIAENRYHRISNFTFYGVPVTIGVLLYVIVWGN